MGGEKRPQSAAEREADSGNVGAQSFRGIGRESLVMFLQEGAHEEVAQAFAQTLSAEETGALAQTVAAEEAEAFAQTFVVEESSVCPWGEWSPKEGGYQGRSLERKRRLAIPRPKPEAKPCGVTAARPNSGLTARPSAKPLVSLTRTPSSMVISRRLAGCPP